MRISVRKREFVFDVEVTALEEQRGSASDAARLYRETQESVDAREAALAARRVARAQQAPGRPTKRDRRRLEDFLDEP
jgi:ribosome-associated heat shock protein Hsp15